MIFVALLLQKTRTNIKGGTVAFLTLYELSYLANKKTNGFTFDKQSSRKEPNFPVIGNRTNRISRGIISVCHVHLTFISIQFPEYDGLYCNYSFVYGQDWAVLSVRTNLQISSIVLFL